MKAKPMKWRSCGIIIGLCAALLLSADLISQPSGRKEEIRNNSEALQKMIKWGSATNGFKMGILAEVVKEEVSYPGEPTVDDSVAFVGWRLHTALVGVSTNTFFVALPPRESLAELRMLDPKRQPVPMTRTGKRMGQPLSVEGKNLFHQGFRRIPVDSEFPDLPGGSSFSLLDLFRVAAPGDYTVVVKLRAATVISNKWVISEFELPPFMLPITQKGVTHK